MLNKDTTTRDQPKYASKKKKISVFFYVCRNEIGNNRKVKTTVLKKVVSKHATRRHKCILHVEFHPYTAEVYYITNLILYFKVLKDSGMKQKE